MTESPVARITGVGDARAGEPSSIPRQVEEDRDDLGADGRGLGGEGRVQPLAHAAAGVPRVARASPPAPRQSVPAASARPGRRRTRHSAGADAQHGGQRVAHEQRARGYSQPLYVVQQRRGAARPSTMRAPAARPRRPSSARPGMARKIPIADQAQPDQVRWRCSMPRGERTARWKPQTAPSACSSSRTTQEIAQVLQRSLRLDGYEVKLAADGVQALDEAHAFLPDLIVLDLGLPRLDGIDVARRLREDGDDVPILMLTARDALESRVEGLDVGADDYLVKPFERQELLARLRALLRRRPPRGMAPLRVGDLMLNPDTHEVSRGERRIELTQREFELLEYLMRNERLVISRQKLLDEVWGYDPFSITNTIEVFVSNLRRKLEAGGEPRLLHTVRGAGYVLRV